MSIRTLLVGEYKVVVDVEDFGRVSNFTWHPHGLKCGNIYFRTTDPKTGKKIMLHRLVTSASTKQVVDHINGDTTDNRRQNLRVCSVAENAKNRKGMKHNRTGYKGVQYKNGRFMAVITNRYKRHHLGIFDTIEEAVKAYNNASKKLHGEFGRPSMAYSTYPHIETSGGEAV